MATILLYLYLIGIPVWFVSVVAWCAWMLRYDMHIGFGLIECKPIVIRYGLGGCAVWPLVAPVSVSMLFLIWWSFRCARVNAPRAANNGAN